MKINLETDEKVKLVVDRTCEFRVWGERNDEGTMIIKYDTNYTTDKSEDKDETKN